MDIPGNTDWLMEACVAYHAAPSKSMGDYLSQASPATCHTSPSSVIDDQIAIESSDILMPNV